MALCRAVSPLKHFHSNHGDNEDDKDGVEVEPGATVPHTAPPTPAIWHSQARVPDDRFELRCQK